MPILLGVAARFCKRCAVGQMYSEINAMRAAPADPMLSYVEAFDQAQASGAKPGTRCDTGYARSACHAHSGRMAAQ
jgi:hypothetical protein